METSAAPRTVSQDFKYYLPRWVVFGILSAVLLSGPVYSPNLDGMLPKDYHWHVVLTRRIPLGIAYGVIAAVLFVAFQRLWNASGNRGKWWVNLIVTIVIAKLAVTGISAMVGPDLSGAVAGTVQKLEEDAKTNHPDAGYTESVRAESAAKSQAYLASDEDTKKKREFAVGAFYGFYFVNTTIRETYCNGQGVSVPAFIQSFKSLNEDTHQKALRALTAAGYTEAQFLEQLSPQLTEMNRKNFEDVAQKDKMTTAAECKYLQDNPDLNAQRVIFSKVQPEAAKLLE